MKLLSIVVVTAVIQASSANEFLLNDRSLQHSTAPDRNNGSWLNFVLGIINNYLQQSRDKGPGPIPIPAFSFPPTLSPSDYRSDFPSDSPSFKISDVPSDMPSNAPSDVPSDTPSQYPIGFHGDSIKRSPPKSFSRCTRDVAIDFDSLTELQVVYLYELQLETGTSMARTISKVESILHEAVLDTICNSKSGARAHAVSSEPIDSPTSSCGEGCSTLLGRLTILVDAETVDGYQGVYCESLSSVRDMIADGGLANLPGIIATKNVRRDGETAPYMCNVDLPDEIANIPGDPKSPVDVSGEGDIEEDREGDGNATLLLSVLGYIGIGSGAFVLLGYLVLRKRNSRDMETSSVVRGASSDTADQRPYASEMDCYTESFSRASFDASIPHGESQSEVPTNADKYDRHQRFLNVESTEEDDRFFNVAL